VAARLIASAAWLAICCSCASLNFADNRIDTAPDQRAVDAAVPGSADLESCLAQLGAPTSVAKSDDGRLFVLTWNWLEQSDWGFSVSIPIGDQSASFNWKDSEAESQFVRLFFDQNWQLIEKAEG
jgi:hypothetical protein